MNMTLGELYVMALLLVIAAFETGALLASAVLTIMDPSYQVPAWL